ncbi:MAG: two-component system response regulator CreB [Verrucomicrobiaceae bacterium]|nr:MAG: two-component system response regulator CreB [Verrucomicrobiaceae bacterium]
MQPRILLVEDEPSIAENIVYALKTEAFEPVWCTTGQEAMSRFAREKFCLVILDVGLPDVNGFELCRKLRAVSTIPIIFVTARKDEIDRVVGLEIGGDDYVVKPFSPRELTARVKAILRRTEHAVPVEVSAAAEPAAIFAIDEERCEIRYHSVPLMLSRYEFRLLKILVEKPGRVFSREQLMDQAWEEPEAALDRTVDAHIKTLRAKLRAVRNDEDPIRTHRGLGYSMKEAL